MCRDTHKKSFATRPRWICLATTAAILLAIALYHRAARAYEAQVDPAGGKAVQMIIRDGRGMEIRVFAHSDLQEAGVRVINLDNYEMDQVVSW
jgi:hypothetical protein